MAAPWLKYQAPAPQAATGPWSKYGAPSGDGPSVVGTPTEATGSEPARLTMRVKGTAAPTAEAPAPTGAFNNATAGLNDALFRVAGAPVDIVNTGARMGAAALHAVGGPDIQLPVDTVGGHQSIADAFGAVGVNDPAKVVASNEGDRLARAAGEGLGFAVAPEGALAALSKLGIVGKAAQELAGMVVGRAQSVPATAANAAAGATGGAGAQGASDVAPEPLKPLAAVVGGLGGAGVAAGAMAIPGAVKAGANIARDFAAPLTREGQYRLAGKELHDSASNPAAALEALNAPAELVPGSQPTTFQQTGDMGLGALERGVAARNPAEFNQRRADQNAARTAAIEGMQETGAPEQVAQAVRQHINAIDQQAMDAVATARQRAQDAANAAGQGQAPENVGDTARAAYENARAAAKEQERALWQAVDPDNTLALAPEQTLATRNAIQRELPASAKPPEGEEAAVYQVLGRYGEVVPFSELTALQSRLKAALRAEVIANGETPAYRRMSQLNGAIQNDLETAVVGKVAQEQQAVAAGTMDAMDTIAARLRAEARAFVDARQAATGEVSGTGAFGSSRSGPATISRADGTEVPSTGRSGNAPRDPRLSPNDLSPNFDQAALSRLTEARGSTLDRVNTFDNKTLAPIRERPSKVSPYNMGSAAVPAKLFFPGPKSADAIATFRAAVGDDQALTILSDYAVDRLRRAALRDDGTLDPGKVAAWRRAHADALRSFPALDARFADAARASEALGEATAAAKAAVDAAQAGAIGKLLGVSDPADVTRTIGSIFARQDAIKQMVALRRAVAGNPEAEQGLRKAVVDYMLDRFVSNTEAATSGLGTVKSDQFQTFIAQNKGALHAAGFSNAELAMMDAVAADLQRANRSIAAVKLPGGSNTTQDVLASNAADSSSTMLMKIILASATSGGAATFAGGPIVGTAVTVATGVIGVLRQQGIAKIEDLVKQAMLDPQLARMLMMKVKPEQVKTAAMTIGQRFRRGALAGAAAAQ